MRLQRQWPSQHLPPCTSTLDGPLGALPIISRMTYHLSRMGSAAVQLPRRQLDSWSRCQGAPSSNPSSSPHQTYNHRTFHNRATSGIRRLNPDSNTPLPHDPMFLAPPSILNIRAPYAKVVPHSASPSLCPQKLPHQPSMSGSAEEPRRQRTRLALPARELWTL
jgi:hypothetical protein